MQVHGYEMFNRAWDMKHVFYMSMGMRFEMFEIIGRESFLTCVQSVFIFHLFYLHAHGYEMFKRAGDMNQIIK